MQFDCSFDEFASYNDGTSMEWDRMRIDSASVIPQERSQVETLYSAASTSLSEVGCLCVQIMGTHWDEQFLPRGLDFINTEEMYASIYPFQLACVLYFEATCPLLNRFVFVDVLF